jgi:4-alpha-glucanotransferase
VAPDSLATWTAREQFLLRDNGEVAEVAGVPPDYFSADGQLWGNPLYDWERQRRDGFAFWLQRLALQADRFDLLRIDHFRAAVRFLGGARPVPPLHARAVARRTRARCCSG